MNIPTLVLSIQIWKKIEKVICRHSLKQNIDMRRNKSYTFGGGRGGLDETLRAPNVFIFATEKEHNFQTDENIALLHLKRKKKTCLSSHRYFVVYFFPLQQLFLSSHNAIYSPLKRERAAWWDWITIVEETAFTSVPLTVSYLKNIVLRDFTMKSKLKLCCICNKP